MFCILYCDSGVGETLSLINVTSCPSFVIDSPSFASFTSFSLFFILNNLPRRDSNVICQKIQELSFPCVRTLNIVFPTHIYFFLYIHYLFTHLFIYLLILLFILFLSILLMKTKIC